MEIYYLQNTDNFFGKTLIILFGFLGIAPGKLAAGPTEAELNNALTILNAEKPKKRTGGPKNLYHAVKQQDLERVGIS